MKTSKDLAAFLSLADTPALFGLLAQAKRTDNTEDNELRAEIISQVMDEAKRRGREYGIDTPQVFREFINQRTNEDKFNHINEIAQSTRNRTGEYIAIDEQGFSVLVPLLNNMTILNGRVWFVDKDGSLRMGRIKREQKR